MVCSQVLERVIQPLTVISDFVIVPRVCSCGVCVHACGVCVHAHVCVCVHLLVVHVL